MGFLDTVKKNVQETAAMAREGVEDLQTRHELGQAYGELGRKTLDLIAAGKLHAPELDSDVERIRKLKAALTAEQPPASDDAAG